MRSCPWRGTSQEGPVISWTRRGLALACLLYALALWAFRFDFAFFHPHGVVAIGRLGHVQSLLLLVGGIAFIWIMENILRSTEGTGRRIIKYPALGSISVGASLCVAAIYRLSTNTITHDILTLCTLITLAGIAFLIFFSIRFKLYDMDIFVSRYIVYHSITFVSIGTYLVVTGMVILWIRHLGMRASLVITGFSVFLVLAVLFAYFLSPEAKARLQFFINTHFFANKYDYRKEWGELSGYLTIAFKENQIIHVTSQVILDSMYIRELSIWLRKGHAYTAVLSFPMFQGSAHSEDRGDRISTENRFCEEGRTNDSRWEARSTGMRASGENRIELAVGMLVGNDDRVHRGGKENPGFSRTAGRHRL